ncbi:unnamed protein product [Clonostachys rosea]|uniref:DOMON domain-containing protein n=1 Tax=Bionectria ochroleuca TaxID=29856 RepID=A0ABY6TNY4_BIOOC|nr:unnamed protein product [Clonostachys rosea]
MNAKKFWLLATLGVGQVSSSPVSFCPDDSDICFQWAVPEAGNANIYFQIDAPTSYQWIGLGIGKQMAGAAMFLMYEDGQGNVTVSNRNGKGHSTPLLGDQDSISLLDGSGVKDGRMIANVLYKNTGSLDLSGSSDWIMAQKQGTPLASVDPNESITVHDSHSAFKINLAQASVSQNVNPFSENNDGGNGVSNGDSTGVTETSSNPNSNLILAHGVILTVVFIALYPLGSLLMPWLGKWYIHGAWQMVGFLAMWAGFGIGYVVSSDLDIFFDQTHTRLGVFVIALLGMQPILGLLHHMQYLRQGRRGAFGHVHIWYGRALIIMGMVNGGLGLQLTGASDVYIIVYSVVAGLSALLYAGYATVKSLRSEKTEKEK